MKNIEPVIRNRDGKTRWCALLVAFVMTIMIVAQLYKFDEFHSVLTLSLPVLGAPGLKILAGMIVIVELLALPYLLQMYLSKLMYVVSAVAAAVVGMFWFMISLTSAHSSDTGLLGGVVNISGGLVAFILSVSLITAISTVIVRDLKRRT